MIEPNDADQYDQWERYERGEIDMDEAEARERQEWIDLGHTEEDYEKNA